MAAVASLQAELRILGSSSKRHNADLSQSSDKSLSILEAASQSFDNDPAIISNLRKYEDFSNPFILACSEASAKSCASALQCIQILATHKAIAPSRLPDLLSALKDATQLGLAIQLKILQVLPVILFEFAADLDGSLIVNLIQVCAELLGANRVGMVRNAAYATLQQLITGVFDRTELRADSDGSEIQKITIDSAETVTYKTSPRLHDAAMIWLDLCDIAENLTPNFLRIPDLPLTFTLELLELTLSNQALLIHKHKELVAVLKLRVIPLLLRLFSESHEFPIILRVVRVFYLLLRQHLYILTTESEVILSTIAQGSLTNTPWKRVVCLEVLQGVLLETDLFLQIYTRFDGESGRLNVIQTISSNFATSICENGGVMLASEMSKEAYDLAVSPGKQDTTKSSSTENSTVSIEASKILTKYACTHTPVIEMLDRVEAPKIKRSHPYYLTIKCMNSLADDIHKLASTDNKHIASMLKSLSTPLLKCFNVTLGIAMDLELFRLVVRGVQRMAHSSGITSSNELRDEFITLLTQYCYIPEDTSEKPWILGHCSLCVRALFNLGYALGNQLQGSWSLITRTIFTLNSQIKKNDKITFDCMFGNSSPEYHNMNLALKKLIESTTHHNDRAVIHFMNALRLTKDDLQFVLLRNLVTMNVIRFANSTSGCWKIFTEILVGGITSSDPSRIAFNVLNDSSVEVLEVVSSTKFDDNNFQVDESFSMVLCSICETIQKSRMELKIAEIQHLNSVLDKFGSRINSGWDEVFAVVSTIPATKNLELMRAAFCTLELICSDFLEKLPYPCIFSLTLCLNEYSGQTSDLNTSFTSTSLFWSVCDHLLACSVGEVDIDSKNIGSEEELVVVAKDYTSSSKRIALWLFAVAKLASLPEKVQQQQVRLSALQIFLRLFNTHGLKLPAGAWKIAHKLIFRQLLESTESSIFQDQKELQEFYILVIDGVGRLNMLYLSQFVDRDSFRSFWTIWMQFLEKAAVKSASVTLAIYKNLRTLLEVEHEDTAILMSATKFWCIQTSLPSYSNQSPKETADSLRELIQLFYHVKDNCDVSTSLKTLFGCALFPYYTTNVQALKMSTLQFDCTEALKTIDVGDNPKLTAELLLLLTRTAKAPYDNMSINVNKSLSSHNFDGISTWSQIELTKLLENMKSTFPGPLPNAITDVLTPILTAMNTISSHRLERALPTSVMLQLIDISPDLGFYEVNDVVEGMRLVLDGFNNSFTMDSSARMKSEIEVVNTIEKFIQIIESKDFSEEGWQTTLTLLLEQSVIYERTIHNLTYYQQPFENQEEALLFGTVDVPRPLHNEKVSLFCLSLLRRLGNEGQIYSAIARDFFKVRMRAILCQYMGDCKLLGQEPLRHLLFHELTFALQELLACNNAPFMDDDMVKLLLKTVSRAHREILPLLQNILQT